MTVEDMLRDNIRQLEFLNQELRDKNDLLLKQIQEDRIHAEEMMCQGYEEAYQMIKEEKKRFEELQETYEKKIQEMEKFIKDEGKIFFT